MSAQDYNDTFSEPFHKDLIIQIAGQTTPITNAYLIEESLSVESSLCSEENLRFGRCESTCLKIRIVNWNTTLKNLLINVSMKCDLPDRLVDSDGNYIVNDDSDYIGVSSADETTIPIGIFRVYDEEVSNDRSWRDLTCYDTMHDILNRDVASWYNNLTFPKTIQSLRNSFFGYVGITQVSGSLVNDSLQVMGGFTSDGVVSGKTIIEAICELNGVFGHINASGQFEYVDLTDVDEVELSYYVDGTGKYEQYTTSAITGIIVRDNGDDVGSSVGTTTNPYVIESNPLTYGLEGTTALSDALTALLAKISQITFRPFQIETYGNPMLKLGTAITINTRDATIHSYVINKTMNGIQALRDKLSAESDMKQPSLVNNTQSQISRTAGKVHDLRIDVDQLTSEITSIEAINKKAIKVYACTSYSTYYPTSDPDDIRIRLDIPISDGSFELLGNSESVKIGVTLPSDFSGNDDEHDLKITVGTTEIIAPIYYEGSALTNQIDAKGGDIMYFNLSTDASGNYSADVIMDTASRSLISQTADGIELMVNKVNSINVPVYEMSSYVYDSVSDTATIKVENIPMESFLEILETPHRIGIKLKAMNATQKAAKKEVWLVAESDSGTPLSFTAPIYDDNNNVVTDAFDGDNIIYLEYDERTISGTSTDGFWIVTDTYSQSQINMANNQIILKVDNNGNLVQVALGADASTGTSFSVHADQILMSATHKLVLTTGSFEVNASNLEITDTGNISVKPSTNQYGSFKVVDSDSDVLGSWGGNYVYRQETFHKLYPTVQDATYWLSGCDFLCKTIYSNGSGDVTGGFEEYMKFSEQMLQLQFVVDPFASAEADRTGRLSIMGGMDGWIDLVSTVGWGIGDPISNTSKSLVDTLRHLATTKTITKSVTNVTPGSSYAVYIPYSQTASTEWYKSGYRCVGLIAWDSLDMTVSRVAIDYNANRQTLVQFYNSTGHTVTGDVSLTFLYVAELSELVEQPT